MGAPGQKGDVLDPECYAEGCEGRCCYTPVSSVAMVLYRLHVLYCPGGIAERTAILKHLEGVSAGEAVVDVIAALRKWKRQLSRSQEMHLTPPDASILLRGIEVISATCVQRHPEMSFRLSLARNELQLQSRPTNDTVMKFYDHLLAEMQQALPNKWATRGSGSDVPRIKAIGAGTGEASSSTSPTSSPTRTNGKGQAGTPCKFFTSDAGCKRGQSCKYQHEFASREEKRARCWHCGSRQHRQAECPIKDASRQSRATATSAPTAAPKAAAMTMATAPEGKPDLPTTATTTTPSSTLASEVGSGYATTVQAEPVFPSPADPTQSPEFQTFMKEVNTMLQRMTRLNRLEVVRPIGPEVAKLDAEMASFQERQESWALLDSGATHPFRKSSPSYHERTQTVQVQFADGQSVALQQNRAGTLMPVKDSVLERGEGLTTIVPLGTLVQELNCTVSWDKRGLRARHPEHGELVTHVSGSCPFIGETRALELISEIEARKLEQLKVNTLETQMKVLGLETEITFETRLVEYRRAGRRADGLGALMAKDSLFGELTESQRCALVQDIDLSDEAGVRYLKALPIKRSLRRKLLSSQWIVNMCAGNDNRSDLKALEEEGLVLLELDVKRSKAFNLREPSSAYRALLWAAMRGQLEGLIGSPPRGEGDGELVKKQFFLWWIAKVAAEEIEARTPYFLMTMPVNSALWTSPMWRQARALAMKLRWATSGTTRCATNLPMTWSQDPWECKGSRGQLEWTQGFQQCLVQGIRRWRNLISMCRINGPRSQMTKEELAKWTQHVRQGHTPYHKRCQTCVASKATGHQHRRVEAPSCFTLSVDVAGPFRVKGQTPQALDYKYMLVGSYTMPVLKTGQCEPEHLIVNEPEGGIGECDPGPSAPGDVAEEPLEDPGPSAHGDVAEEPLEDPGPSALGEDLEKPEESVDMEGLFELEGDEVIQPVGDLDQDEMARLNEQYNELVKEVGDKMNYQVLRYAVPMRSRRSSEVNARVRQMYLQVKADGLEVFRLHSDRATAVQWEAASMASGARSTGYDG